LRSPLIDLEFAEAKAESSKRNSALPLNRLRPDAAILQQSKIEQEIGELRLCNLLSLIALLEAKVQNAHRNSDSQHAFGVVVLCSEKRGS
jgi:hypothetical protein